MPFQVTAAQVPATAATCKAALDAANKALTDSNGDFTTVIQPNGATAENNEYIHASNRHSAEFLIWNIANLPACMLDRTSCACIAQILRILDRTKLEAWHPVTVLSFPL